MTRAPLMLTRRLMMGAVMAGLAAPNMALAQAKPKIGFIGSGRLAALWRN